MSVSPRAGKDQRKESISTPTGPMYGAPILKVLKLLQGGSMVDCVEGLRHYEVVSPEMSSGYSGYEPPEYGRDWGLFLAKNKRDAILQAVRSDEFSNWVGEARGDNITPFSGLKATLPLCEHGKCWGCDEFPKFCEECAKQDENWEDWK